MEFGKLTGLGEDGTRYPDGEYRLSTFASFPAWALRRNEDVLATSADRQTVRDRALKRLIGRRLKTMAINEPHVLPFSYFHWGSCSKRKQFARRTEADRIGFSDP